MNCYSHPHAPAVALCKACAKGVCGSCAIDTGVGVAYPDDVEAVAAAVRV